jgi:NAD(P)-dependent dehydrogenase (short-subunit alcohol dehydrogenase family)
MPGALLVTGGSRGIGAAIARRAAANGWDVAITYTSREVGPEAVIADLVTLRGRSVAVRADSASEDDVVRAFDETEAALGPIAALVCNAGITGGFARVADVEVATLERVFAVNAIGTMLCCREAVRRMSTARGGRGGGIVTITSRAAQLGSAGEWVHYAASKAAVETFTRGLAREVAEEGIRVNAVSPGLIDTTLHADAGAPERLARLAPAIPLKRPGTPDEVAAAVLWLLSEESSYVTGTVIEVSGGR